VQLGLNGLDGGFSWTVVKDGRCAIKTSDDHQHGSELNGWGLDWS
jgi:hypothetical protein